MTENNEPQDANTATPSGATPVDESGSRTTSENVRKFAGQAKDILSKVDAGKAFQSTDKVTGKFMAGVYKTLKILAAILSLGCLVTMVYALFSYMTTPTPSVHAPVFDSSVFESGGNSAKPSKPKPTNEEFREIRNKFGDRIDSVIDAANLDAKEDYNNLVEILYNLDSEYRAEYIDGALPYMKELVSWARRKGENPDQKYCRYALYEHTSKSYDAFFSAAVDNVAHLEEIAEAKRASHLSLAESAVLFLMMLVIMALLIQIEENTRK